MGRVMGVLEWIQCQTWSVTDGEDRENRQGGPRLHEI